MTAAAARPPPGTVVRLLRLAGFPILRQLQLEEALLRCVALWVRTAAHRCCALASAHGAHAVAPQLHITQCHRPTCAERHSTTGLC